MPSEILVKSGSTTAVTFTSLASLVTATTSGAQSAKIDLGATRAQQMLVRLQATFNTAPTAGGALEVYVGFSSQSTTNSGNPANLTGVDSGWSGYSSDAGFAKRQLTFVGILSACNVTSAQVADVGTFTPMDRYACFVVCSGASQTLVSTTTSHSMTIYPLVDEAQ